MSKIENDLYITEMTTTFPVDAFGLRKYLEDNLGGKFSTIYGEVEITKELIEWIDSHNNKSMNNDKIYVYNKALSMAVNRIFIYNSDKKTGSKEISLKYAKVRDVKSPQRGTDESAGLDFYIPDDFNKTIHSGESALIPAGIHVNLPKGTMLQVCNKSGVASKLGLLVGAEIIDSDYQGEIHLNVWNVSNKSVKLEAGKKLVQMILIPILLPKEEEMDIKALYLEKSQRGTGGFGSTGE